MTRGREPPDKDGNDQSPSDAVVDTQDQPGPVEPGDQAMKALLDGVQSVAREEDAEIEALSREADQPLAQAARDRIARRILEARHDARSPSEASSFTPIGEKPTAGSAAAPRGSARRRRRFVSLVGAGGIVAAAAAFALWARPSSQDLVLPAYSVTASGGVREQRGATPPPGADDTTAALQRVRPDSELVIAVRPETTVAGAVAARAFLVQGTEVSEARAQTQIAPSGAVELRLRGVDLVGPRRGHALLRILVGRPSVIASAASPTIENGASGPGLRVLTVPVDLEAP
jgi:hypothetical protein